MFPAVLSGVKVVDFSRLLPGPFASELLIKLGAEVQCILPPVPDPILGDYSPFQKLHRGKSFKSINLKDPEGLSQAKEIVSQSQILLEGFRPGTMEKLGLGFSDACQVQPHILYVSLSGYDPQHPKFFKGAHDLNFLIDSGLYSMIYPDTSREVPIIQLADVLGGFYAAFQILVEWLRKSKDRKARHCQVSIVEGLELLSDYLHDPSTPQWLAYLSGGTSRYHIYTTKDGYRIMVAAIEQKFYDNLLKTLKVEISLDLEESKKIEAIQKAFSGLSLKECRILFKDVDACISLIPSREEVLKT